MRRQLIDWLALGRKLLLVLGLNVMLVLITIVEVEPNSIKEHSIVVHALEGKFKEAHVIGLQFNCPFFFEHLLVAS